MYTSSLYKLGTQTGLVVRLAVVGEDPRSTSYAHMKRFRFFKYLVGGSPLRFLVQFLSGGLIKLIVEVYFDKHASSELAIFRFPG